MTSAQMAKHTVYRKKRPGFNLFSSSKNGCTGLGGGGTDLNGATVQGPRRAYKIKTS